MAVGLVLEVLLHELQFFRFIPRDFDRVLDGELLGHFICLKKRILHL